MSEIVTRYNRITTMLELITEEHLRLGRAIQQLQKENEGEKEDEQERE